MGRRSKYRNMLEEVAERYPHHAATPIVALQRADRR